mgnify:CR=1 FL=1
MDEEYEYIKKAVEHDEHMREQIRESIERHDRAFFAQVVSTVASRLNVTLHFTEELYQRFREKF